jgi:hypothetical protein
MGKRLRAWRCDSSLEGRKACFYVQKPSTSIAETIQSYTLVAHGSNFCRFTPVTVGKHHLETYHDRLLSDPYIPQIIIFPFHWMLHNQCSWSVNNIQINYGNNVQQGIWVTGADISLGIKRPERQADDSLLPSTAKFRICWAIPPLSYTRLNKLTKNHRSIISSACLARNWVSAH